MSITPTEEQISSGSIESVTPQAESKTVPILICDTESSSVKDLNSDSLGYVSLKEKLDSLELSERPLKEVQSGDRGCPTVTTRSLSAEENNIKTNPVINVIECTEKCVPSVGGQPSFKHCCSCSSCPCYDKPLNTGSFTKDLEYHTTKVKECESIEEGYHSMEEPHSPSRVKMHLSEMLKQFENWCPEGLEEVPLPEYVIF